MKKSIVVLILCLWNVVFVTAQNLSKAPLFSFGVITDVQYYDGPNAGSRYYKSSPEKLSKIVEAFNEQPIDFVVNLGDLIDQNWASYDDLLPILSRLKMPIYHVLGNHDFSVEAGKIGQVATKLSMPARYYAIKHKHMRLLFLDGNDHSTYGQEKGSKLQKKAVQHLSSLKEIKSKNAQEWNGGLGNRQLKWLKKQLDKSAKAGEIVLINCHFPIQPVGASHNLWNDKEVVSLLNQYPHVKAWFNGHNHVGGYEWLGGKHFVNFKGIVERDNLPWSIVEVYDDHLIINGQNEEPDRLLNFTSFN
jgi:3',5'-cyclic AMP phosphodiesterase CpdA